MSTTKKNRTVIYAFGLDIGLIIVFALFGRSSHQETLSFTGVLITAWPFLAALVLAWLLTRSWNHPVRLWPNGICIWLITVSGGMALRILVGGTAAIPFVIVATAVLGLFLLGHRGISLLLARRAK